MKPIQSNLQLLFVDMKNYAHIWNGSAMGIGFLSINNGFIPLWTCLCLETSNVWYCLLFDLKKLKESFNVWCICTMHNETFSIAHESLWTFRITFSLPLLRTEVPLGNENTMPACLQQKVLLFNEMMHYNLRK